MQHGTQKTQTQLFVGLALSAAVLASGPVAHALLPEPVLGSAPVSSAALRIDGLACPLAPSSEERTVWHCGETHVVAVTAHASDDLPADTAIRRKHRSLAGSHALSEAPVTPAGFPDGYVLSGDGIITVGHYAAGPERWTFLAFDGPEAEALSGRVELAPEGAEEA